MFAPPTKAPPSRRDRRGEAGTTMIEVILTATLLIVASLSLAYSVSTSSVASKGTDRMLRVQQSLDESRETIDQLPFHELQSWDGVEADFGDHRITATILPVEDGLLLVELTARDDQTNSTVARVATYRSGDR